MNQDLTQGPVMRSMLLFAVPMILGNLLQQCYNIADTLIVGQFLGKNALAAVGSSFSLMTFLTSILLGLCMGSGALFSIRFGRRDEAGLRESICASFALIAAAALLLCGAAFACLDHIRVFLRVPAEVWGLMREYLFVIFWGIAATFLYNYFASLLRALGNSVVPLMFLAISAILNIILDLWFVLGLKRGTAGAAEATVIAQYVSGIGIALYAWARCPQLRDIHKSFRVRWSWVREIAGFSVLTCVQQSVMNLGILMVQGLVNSFGPAVMAAFAATVKIDAFAYMPVQDFGNAFSTFIAQNYGAKKEERIRAGLKGAAAVSMAFCLAVSALVWIFAHPLMTLFVDTQETEVILEGIRYLHIEGVFYCGIGCLFLLYGLYRALGKPGMSVVLTVISLGTRVALAYTLSAAPSIGVTGIWWSAPIGWALADMTGIFYYIFRISRRRAEKTSHSNQNGGDNMIRRIIQINEEACTGCGACAAACHEGAIAMVGGKAKLTREDYCDGLGDCLPACPAGAITFEVREAPAYDEGAVRAAKEKKAASEPVHSCPGSRTRVMERGEGRAAPSGAVIQSQLAQWPVQIKLVPVNAPCFNGADLLIAADCTAYAYGNFHNDFICGRVTLIGCPKLDATDYSEKLAQILSGNQIKSITVARMEVPCCGGMEQAVKRAIQASGKDIPCNVAIISADGRKMNG